MTNSNGNYFSHNKYQRNICPKQPAATSTEQCLLKLKDHPLSFLDSNQCHACSLNLDFRYRKCPKSLKISYSDIRIAFMHLITGVSANQSGVSADYHCTQASLIIANNYD